jgi:RNA polymerase sigma-70 factor (ECF subfamily)
MVAASRIQQIASGRERSFLVGVALRTAAAARRKLKRRREHQDERAVSEARDPGPRPDELLDRRKAMRLLDVLLEEMPERLRSVFVLHEIERLTTHDIAELLELPEGTVASRLRRAREVFQKRVAQLKTRLRLGAGP